MPRPTVRFSLTISADRRFQWLIRSTVALTSIIESEAHRRRYFHWVFEAQDVRLTVIGEPLKEHYPVERNRLVHSSIRSRNPDHHDTIGRSQLRVYDAGSIRSVLGSYGTTRSCSLASFLATMPTAGSVSLKLRA